jgi:uncharacterized DUF497 family protein
MGGRAMGLTIISDDGRYEWDAEKARENMLKHKVAFSEITDVFDDPLFIEDYDDLHSTSEEDRFYGIGNVNGLMLTVFFTERPPRTRLYSARISEPIEEDEYYDNIRKTYP